VLSALLRVAFASFSTLLVAGCTQTFFQPDRVLVATPDRLGVRYETVELRAADGIDLVAWFLPARGTPAATVLFLHGNAENISTHFANVAWMPAEGFNVLALDYRGYGASAGSPSLAGVQLDIDAALGALLERRDVDPRRIVLFGQSLGGALAIHYAARGAHRSSLRAVIADSAFADYRLIVKEKMAGFFLTWPFQWLPALTVDNDYSPRAAIGAVSPIPLVLIHGESDAIVPPHHSRQLYEAAAQPKELWIAPAAGHTQSLRDPALRNRLSNFMRSAVR
jgi:fermentation-respiration switch protein FrsA (DUF1100 family)